MISEEIVHIKGTPKKLVVFLHGYCDNAEYVDRHTALLQEIDDLALHIPQAPYTSEIDENKRQWYSMHRFDPDDKRRETKSWEEFIGLYNQMTVGLEEAKQCILEYVDDLLLEYGLSYNDLFLCGFSQGAMCAIYSGLMCPCKMAGVISFSGILAAKGYVAKHFYSKPDFLLIHGKDDNKVRFDSLGFTEQSLLDLGCRVEKYITAESKHVIAEEAVAKAGEFIKQRL